MIEVNGFEQFEKKLDSIAKIYPKKVNQFMNQQAELLVGYAKDETPTSPGGGTLKNGWKRAKVYLGKIQVYNNTEYAAHVEYGHRLKIKGEWAKDASGKTRFIKGVKMLHKAMDTMEDEFEDNSRAILKELLK